jgi:hypothetical protein
VIATISLVGLRVLAHAVDDLSSGLGPDGQWPRKPEREGVVDGECDASLWIRFDDMTSDTRSRDEVTVLDVELYRERVAAAARRSLLPAWGKHQRMGHTVLYGFLEPAGHGTARLTVPGVEGDELYADLPEEVHIVPMEGPAFFGFQVLTEETVMGHRRMARRMKPRAYEPPPDPPPRAPVPVSLSDRPAPEVGQRIEVCFLKRAHPTTGNLESIGGDFDVVAVGDGGAPVQILRTAETQTPRSVDNFLLTATEWQQCVFSVISADGQSIFDEIPF